MKLLLAFLVTFSVFANDQFTADKESAVKRLQASNAAPTVVTCVQNAKNMDELTACEKTPVAKHAKYLGTKTKAI